MFVMKGNARFIIKKQWGENQVIIFPIIKNRFVDLFLGNTAYMFFLLFKGLFARYDLLHVHNGASEGFISMLIKKIRRRNKFSYGYTFPFIQALEIKIINSSLIKRLYYKSRIYLFKQSLISADIVFPISKHLGKELSSTLDISPVKQFIVSEAASEVFLKYVHIQNPQDSKLRLIYIGSLAKVRNPEFIIRVFEIVSEKIENIELLILGWADKNEETVEFMNLIKNSVKSSQIRFVGKVPYEEVPAYIASCHVGLSPIIPTDIYLVSTPTKCIEYLSLGIPVVANYEIPDQNFVIAQSSGGLLTKYNVDDFAEKILCLLQNKELRQLCGNNGKRWIAENRTFERLAVDLNIQLKKIIN